jgi:GntR family transcriptional repressor for pyruvate dehydrogenase complex
MEIIARTSLSDTIVDQIVGMIASGQIKAEEKLPPERQLCEMLGVSRLPLREALARLEAMGIVECLHGNGNYIRNISADLLLKNLTPLLLAQGETSFRHVMEVRRTIEAQIVVLACQYHNKDRVNQLRQIIEKMKQCIDEVDEFIVLDMQFHLTLAAMSNNPIFRAIMVSMYDLLMYAQKAAARSNKALDRAINYHKEICDAISEKNEDKAKEIILNHLADIEKAVIRSGVLKGVEGK